MKKVSTTLIASPPTGMGAVGKAWDAVSVSFDRFCLTAGIEALGTMMEKDAEQACGARHARSDGRRGHRWGRTQGKIGFHAGKVAVERPRVRDLGGRELALPSWDRAVAEDWLGKWAMNLMLINVSTRKFRRAVRLPEGDVPAPAGAGISKSATSRHFVALSAARMKEWMGADLSGLDIMVVQIDGIHISEHLVLVAALGIDSAGFKHPLGLMEGATEHSAVVQALIDDLIERGLDPAVPRLFIIDGSKALAKAIRRSFGRHTPIQRCQVHYAEFRIMPTPSSCKRLRGNDCERRSVAYDRQRQVALAQTRQSMIRTLKHYELDFKISFGPCMHRRKTCGSATEYRERLGI